MNDGQTDLAGYRGIVAENPFSITNPEVLDWAYISGEHRWVRRNSSTWVYAPGPAAFDSRYRSQHAAERAGQTTVGRFIFDSNKHAMRIIRDYQGNTPGAAIYAWVAFDAPTLNLEDWAFRDEHIQVQARKLAQFPQHEIDSIPNNGEKFFKLTARVHTDATGTLTSYDLAEWEVVGAGGGATISRYHLLVPAASYVHRAAGAALSFADGESVWTMPYPTGTTFTSMRDGLKTAVLQRDSQLVAEIGPAANEASATQLWGYAPC